MEVRDPIYCFEVARRSVSRAALHLGIENMSETALDVLADILLNYLGRVGRTLSHLVETNGRTSAHANFLDALTACEMEAPPIVQQLNLRDPQQQEGQLYTTNTTNTVNGTFTSLHNSTRDWKGLASFLFGPRWLESSNEEDENQETGDEGGSIEGGGKHGGKHFPSSNDNTDDDNDNNKKKNVAGWQAPYPDEVPPFPRTSNNSTCANPHPLSSWVGLSLHRGNDAEETNRQVDGNSDEDAATETETELKAIPDNAFLHDSLSSLSSPWGSLTDTTTTTTQTKASATTATNSKKRKHSAEDIDAVNNNNNNNNDSSPAPAQPSKKAKTTNEGGNNTAAAKDKDKKGTSSLADKNNGKKDSSSKLQQEKMGEGKAEDDGSITVESRHQLPHVPSFYPLPPSMERLTTASTAAAGKRNIRDESRKVLDIMNNASSGSSSSSSGDNILQQQQLDEKAITEGSHKVRSSLVQLESSYWGSGWNDSSSKATTTSNPILAVPLGRRDGGGEQQQQQQQQKSTIVPLGRASGSRVSRILEGSMDAAAMQ